MNKYGLIGKHLSHSFSPILHEIIFKNSHIKGQYKLYEVERENLKERVKRLKSLEIKGFNVTIPYKEEVIDYLDEISIEAKNIGAVNTLEYKDRKIIGHNTDYYGFGQALKRENIHIRGKKALILGTGGASKSVFHYLKNNGIKEIIFASRKPKDVENPYKDFKVIDYSSLKNISSIELIVNTTPLGMYPNIDESPIDESIISNCNAIVDLIYNPLQTELLKLGEKLGIKTSNGLYMLVAQGIKSQEIWNEIEFDEEFYHRVFKGVLEYVK